MSYLAAFASGFPCFFRSKLVGCASLVSYLAAFAPGFPCFFRGKFMGCAFLVTGLTAFAGNGALLFCIH
jgi:hypothetical protein